MDKFKYEEDDITAKIVAILSLEGFVDRIDEETSLPCGIILESTSFYAEAGGQVE